MSDNYTYSHITEDVFHLKNRFGLESERQAVYILSQNEWNLDKAMEEYDKEPHEYCEENDIIKDMDWDEFIEYIMCDYNEFHNSLYSEFNIGRFNLNDIEYHISQYKKIDDYIINDYMEEIMDKTRIIECPICLNNINSGLSTNCNHKYCKKCIKTWIIKMGKDTCPICKRDNIKLYKFIK